MNIVSFFAPRPSHPFFQDYTPFLSLLRLSCARFGHRHIVITDDPAVGRDGDAFVVDLPGDLMHAALAAQLAYLQSEHAGQDTVLVGADCVLANDPAALFAEQEFDVAFTTGPFADCILNTGAIFVRGGKADAATVFWQAALDICPGAWGDDQRALAWAVNPTLKHGLYHRRGLGIRFLPVDPYNLAPDFPGQHLPGAVILHFRGPRKGWMVDYCKKHLDLGEGISALALPNVDDVKMIENVRRNGARDLRWVEEAPAHDRHAVLVGGGPSLADTLDEVRGRAADGQTIFALNGAAAWLAEHGVEADYLVVIDPRESNACFVEPLAAREAILASQCAPAVFDAVPEDRTMLFHCAVDGVAATLQRPGILIGGGLTSGLTAMALAFTLGYRQMHLYGYDSSDRDGDGHAYAQAETDAEKKRLEVWHGEKRFSASFAMFKQAEAFPDFAQMLANEGCIITVHGDGLLPSVARAMSTATPYQDERIPA